MDDEGALQDYAIPHLPGERYLTIQITDRDLSESEITSPAFLPPETSVIVPTRNEAGNINELLYRLLPVVRHPRGVEVIFVDDSTDDTPEVIRQAARNYVAPVQLIHREAGMRTGGLGGAVLEGMRAARGQWIVVMDADLQHPPELISDLRHAALSRSLDLVVASRYCANGSASSFGPIRAVASQGTTAVTKALFPRKLKDVNDPMSGFFMVRRSSLNLDELRPNGFKILLEVVTKSPRLRIGSVPFSFGERFAGDSKASLREGIRFLQLLLTLRLGIGGVRFLQFSLIGVSGLLVNTAMLAFWTEAIGLFYLVSLILATQASSLWNFALSERLAFKRKSWDRHLLVRGTWFVAMNNVALLARGPIVFVITSVAGVNYLISNVLSMLALLIVRYAIADSLIWRTPAEQTPNLQTSLPALQQESEVAA